MSKLLKPKKEIITFDGQKVNTTKSVWTLKSHNDAGDTINIDFNKLKPRISGQSLISVKLFVEYRLETRHANTARNDYSALCKLSAFLQETNFHNFTWKDFTSFSIDEFSVWCKGHLVNWGNILSSVSIFYEWGFDMGFPAFQYDTLAKLKIIKKPSAPSGHNTRFRNPTKDAFTDDEMAIIIEAICQRKGKIFDRVLVCLCLETGSNPTPLARLLNKDFFRVREQYYLSIPASKSRHPLRTIIRETPISPLLGDLLTELKAGNEDDQLLHWLGKVCPTSHMRYKMNRWAKDCKLESPRTKATLNLNPRRMRCRFTTDMSQENDPQIASNALGHTGTKTVKIYLTSSPSISNNLASATDRFYVPAIAQFLGESKQPLPPIQSNPKHITQVHKTVSIGKTVPFFPENFQFNIEQFNEYVMKKFQSILGNTTNNFSALVWDVSSLEIHYKSVTNLRFSQGKNEAPWPYEFALVVKDQILDASSVANMQDILRAGRLAWESFGDTNFSWQNLKQNHFVQLEKVLQERCKTSASRFHAAFVVSQLVNRATTYGLCRPGTYAMKFQISKKEQKLPTRETINFLAHIYQTATEPRDRLRICIVILLFLTGFRISELLSMPLDCEVEENFRDKLVYGLRYYVKKKPDGENIHDIRWLSPAMSTLAKRVVGEIRQITDLARKQALVFEKNPEQYPIKDYAQSARLTKGDVARILGYKPSKTPWLPEKVRQLGQEDDGGKYYTVENISAYIANQQKPSLWSLKLAGNKKQLLSESLFVIFSDFFSSKRTNFLFVSSISPIQINQFLGSDKTSQSIFQRFGLQNEDGSYPQLSTHKFRHLLNHIADVGGMPPHLQTRWFGRTTESQTFAYHHTSLEDDREQLAKAMNDFNDDVEEDWELY